MGAIIAAIDWNAVVPVLLSGGVFAQGLGAMRWVARVEMRLEKLEKEQANG